MSKWHKSRRSFDNLSNIYWIIEYLSFGTLLEQARRSSFSVFELLPHARLLIFGDGDGRFACEALNRFSNIHIDSIDYSQSMINAATNRIQQTDSVNLDRYNSITGNALS